MIYEYQGSFFAADNLHFLKPTFAESYFLAIRNNFHKTFIRFYDKADLITQRTFGQFASDVEALRTEIARTESTTTIVCVDDNSYEFLVHIVAALLEARTLCPISPLEGAERVALKIASLPQPVKVFVGKTYQKFLGRPASVMILPDGTSLSPDDLKPAKHFAEDQAFILIFTSGTTGVSKIVRQREVGVLVNVDALIERHGLDLPKTVATCLPVYHVNALEFSFFSTLLSGSRLVLFSQFNLLQMVTALQTEKIEILSIVPSLIYALNRAAHMVPANIFSKTDYVVTAAAPLPAQVAKEFIDKFACRIIQGYGLSEAVNFSLLTPTKLSPKDYEWSLFSESVPSVGTALRGGEVFILSAESAVLEEGVVGEIALRGFNIMHGYLNEDPKTTFQGGYFRTGDLGFYKTSPQGERFFFITGRIKEIVKRFAVTVSLSEIEREALSLPGRKFEAIAVGFANDRAGEEIALVLNIPEGESEDLSELFLYLRSHLPSHHRPRLFVISKRPVRGPSGKAKRGDFIEYLAKFKTVSFDDKEIIERD